MGSYYCVEMVDVLQAAGVECAVTGVNEGWESRARSSGGWESKAAILGYWWHHTASSTTPANDLAYMCNNADDAPIGNLYIDRDGVCWPIAAGASNCAGKGGPYTFSRGTVPLDGGNTRGWQCEVANGGTGERWPEAQVDAFFKASNALNAHVGNLPTDIITHHIWAPSRKIDPATAAAVEGPWRPGSVNSSGTWSLDDIRHECTRRAQPDPEPIPPPEEEDMLRKVLVPRLGPNDPPWWPWLATFDSGAVRPLVSGEPEPASGKSDIDVSQYKALCAWAGINLEVQP